MLEKNKSSTENHFLFYYLQYLHTSVLIYTTIVQRHNLCDVMTF